MHILFSLAADAGRGWQANAGEAVLWESASVISPKARAHSRRAKESDAMTEDALKAHLRYLKDEVRKTGERADSLEAMLPDLKSEQKKRAVRELVNHLRDEVSERSKYLALVRQK